MLSAQTDKTNLWCYNLGSALGVVIRRWHKAGASGDAGNVLLLEYKQWVCSLCKNSLSYVHSQFMPFCVCVSDFNKMSALKKGGHVNSGQ